MNALFTKWIYPLREPIHMSDDPQVILDNPRTDEIEEIAKLLEANHRNLDGFFSSPAEEDYKFLEEILSKFCDRLGPSDSYINEILSDHKRDSVFMSFARIWVVARYDDEGQEEELQRQTEQMQKDERVGVIVLDDDHPIVLNSIKLRNYLSVLAILIQQGGDTTPRQPILINSSYYPDTTLFFNENHLRLAFVTFSIFAYDHENGKSENSEWVGFPYLRERLLKMNAALSLSIAKGHGDLLQYIGSIHSTVEYETDDIRVRFLLLVSLIELLITHNPDTNRFNVEDSISRQFRFKTTIMLHREQPDIDLEFHEKRLKQLYSLRSAVAHGDFKALKKYEAGLSKKEGKEEYMDEIVTDVYFYLKAVLEQFLKDPEFVFFVKKS